MSNVTTPAGYKVISARGNNLCRCGNHTEIGDAVLEISGVKIRVSIFADGIRWPSEVVLSPDLETEANRFVRAEWLRLMGEYWAKGNRK